MKCQIIAAGVLIISMMPRLCRNILKRAEIHYENTPMQYTAIFHGCENDNFQMTNCDVFLIFAQNIDYGYTLEPPQ